jgi:exopolysaccharide biosynthesis polyprenyl glycosylphosphotransferase
LVLTDLICLVGVFVACDLVADSVRGPIYRLLNIEKAVHPDSTQIYWILLPLAVSWILILSMTGFYAWHWWTPSRLSVRSIGAGILLALAFSTLALFLQRPTYPRMHLLFVVAIATIVLLATRLILIRNPKLIHSLGRRFILVVGAGKEAVKFTRVLSRRSYANVELIGHLTYKDQPPNRRISENEILGGVEDLQRILDRRVVDEVVFALPTQDLRELSDHIAHCEEVGTPCHVMAEQLLGGSNAQVVDFHGATLLSFGSRQGHAPELLAVKRIFDVVFAFAALLLLSPVLIVLGVMVKLSSRGPFLYNQERVGRNGRLFAMYKFRTMVHDADRRLDEVAHLNQLDGPVFKTANDPRVTKVGRWMRRHSLDELPQLLNVIRGEMSIVGPRPPLADEVAQYSRAQRRRLSMNPGITGLWQVSGRTNVPFREWVRLDLQYIDNWSLGLDLRIMCKTMWVMAVGTGI